MVTIQNLFVSERLQMKTNAMKETLAGEHDRNTASPTESAVDGKR